MGDSFFYTRDIRLAASLLVCGFRLHPETPLTRVRDHGKQSEIVTFWFYDSDNRASEFAREFYKSEVSRDFIGWAAKQAFYHYNMKSLQDWSRDEIEIALGAFIWRERLLDAIKQSALIVFERDENGNIVYCSVKPENAK